MAGGHDFFTSEEQERIARAVAAAESATAGEIATVVVPASDGYREGATLGGVLLAATLALIISLALHHESVWFFIPLAVLLYLPCRLLCGRFLPLCLIFIPRRRVRETVRERAVRAFYEQGLYRTSHGTGILIFISLGERTVWILGDRGINERIPQESWQTLAGQVARGVKEGQACQALCAVITACGAVLTEHFPHQPGDRNELPDRVVFDE
jgi:putative membrane protein